MVACPQADRPRIVARQSGVSAREPRCVAEHGSTGGVEWNACVYGHSPYNCSPLFAAAVEDPQYGNVLRLYEWDRTRCVPFQLDFCCPRFAIAVCPRAADESARQDDPDVLVVEHRGLGVAGRSSRRSRQTAYTYDYWGPVQCGGRSPGWGSGSYVPDEYPLRRPIISFESPTASRPWITRARSRRPRTDPNVDGRQVGRKLFAWGSQTGGDRWQEFLSTPGQRFFEIQAGLVADAVGMLAHAAGAQWEWMEAYGLMEADPRKTHASDWKAAVREVDDRLGAMATQASLEERCHRIQCCCRESFARSDPASRLWLGGAQRLRRERHGAAALCSPALVFDDDSLTADQRPWLALLDDGRLPEREPDDEPGAWMIQEEWRALLESSVRRRAAIIGSRTPLGLDALRARRRRCGSHRLGEESSDTARLAWAYRNLAVLSRAHGRHPDAPLTICRRTSRCCRSFGRCRWNTVEYSARTRHEPRTC